MKKVKEKAKKNVEILGYQKDHQLCTLLQNAKGFVFAAVEDFGILPVEAQACGTPVIAFGKGGALESIVENQTGIFFKEQTVSSLIQAIHQFEKETFDPCLIRRHAERFDVKCFTKQFQEYVMKVRSRVA